MLTCEAFKALTNAEKHAAISGLAVSGGGRDYLGLFGSPEEAYCAWVNAKLDIALNRKPEMDDIDERIYPRVVEIIREVLR